MDISKIFTLKPSKLSETNICSLAIIALLIFIPLYPKFPLFNVPKTYVAIRAEDILVAIVLFVWFLLQLKNGFSVFRERISRLIILYWCIGFLSLIGSLLITRNIIPHLGFLHFFRRIEYMSLFFVALSSIKEVRNTYTHLLILLFATLGVIVYGFGQKFFNWPVISTMNEEFSKGLLLHLTVWTRVNSTFAGHYDLAAYIVMILAITLAFLVWEKKIWVRSLIAFFGLLTLYLLVLTASRISFAAYLLAVVLTLILLKKPLWLGPVIVFSVLFISFSGELTERYAVTVSNFRSSFLSPKDELEVREDEIYSPLAVLPEATPTTASIPVEEKAPSPPKKEATTSAEIPTPGPPEPVKLAAQRSADIRFKIEWPRAINAFLKNPFLGTGYSSITLATDNDYLRLLGETGLLGFISFSLIFLELFRKVFFFLKKAPFDFERVIVIGILGGVVGFLANACFIDVFEASKVAFVFWILIGTLVGTINITKTLVRTT